MNGKKIYTLKNLKEDLETCLIATPVVKINLHNEKSCKSDSVFSTIILPSNKYFTICGNYEILYSQLSKYGEHEPCYVNFVFIEED